MQSLIHSGSSAPADTGTLLVSNCTIFTIFFNAVNGMNTVNSKHKTEFLEKK